MAEEVDWIQTLDRMNTVLARIYQSTRECGTARKILKVKAAVAAHLKRQAHFFLRRLADAEFSRFIDEKLDYTKSGTKKRGAVVERNMKLLAEFILEDVAAKANKKWATANSIRPHSADRPPGSEEKQQGRSYARFHELLREFPELVLPPTEVEGAFKGKKFAEGRRIEDRRETVVATPHTRPQNFRPELFLWFIALVRDRWRGAELKDFLTRAVTQIAYTEHIQIAFLPALRKRRLFETYVGELMSRLGLIPAFRGNAEAAVLRKRLVHFVAELLYSETRVLAELHWFSRLSKSKQDALLFREPRPLKELSPREGARCIAEAREWLPSDYDVFYRVNLSMEALLAMNFAQTAERLLDAALKQLDLSTEDRALALHAIGMAYRVEGRIPEQRRAIEDSLSKWKQVEDHPGDQAVEYGYLAELARADGDFSGYQRLSSQAEELAASDILTQKRKANVVLYLADCAEIYGDVSWELRLLERGLSIASREEGLIGHFEYFDQCIKDLKLQGRRSPEIGDGRVRRPPEIRTEPMSGLFEVAIDDPYFGN